MWETLITIASGVNTFLDLHHKISAVLRGGSSVGSTESTINRIATELGRVSLQVERLSDHILYLPHQEGIRDLTQSLQHRTLDLREVRACLEPIQQALQEDMVSSSMIPTPDRLLKAMKKSPWDVLVEIRPAYRAETPTNSALIPAHYIGWTPRGSLPGMFDCEYNELWIPESAKQVFEKPSVNFREFPSQQTIPQNLKQRIQQPTKVKETEKKWKHPMTPEQFRMTERSQDQENVYTNASIDQTFKGKFRKNYNRLQLFLEQGKWKEADQETAKIIHGLIGRSEIRLKDIRKIPYSNLYTLDYLWTQHSQGRFGFSVQKEIYQSTGGVAADGYNPSKFEEFSRRIGWYIFKPGNRDRGGGLLGTTELSYTLSAPPGHLPASWILPPQSTGFHSVRPLEAIFYIILCFVGLVLYIVGIFVAIFIVWLMFSRAKDRQRLKKLNIENTIVALLSRIQECG